MEKFSRSCKPNITLQRDSMLELDWKHRNAVSCIKWKNELSGDYRSGCFAKERKMF